MSRRFDASEVHFSRGSVLSVLVAAISAVLFGLSLGFTSPAIDVMQGTVTMNGQAVKVPSDLVVFKSKAEGSLFSSLKIYHIML